MILNEEQTKIITSSGVYGCELMKQQWSYALLGAEMSPLGNIIVFESPLQTGKLELEKVMVVAAHLPNTNSFGGVSFLRLYSAQIGSLLTHILQKNCYVDQNNIFVEDKQASITITNKLKDSFLFHIIFSTGQSEGLYSLAIEDQAKEQLKTQIVDSFHFLTRSIFLETQRDSF